MAREPKKGSAPAEPSKMASFGRLFAQVDVDRLIEGVGGVGYIPHGKDHVRTAAICRYIALVGNLCGRDGAAVVELAERRQIKGGAGQRLRSVPVRLGDEIAPAGGAVTRGQLPVKEFGPVFRLSLFQRVGVC